MSKALLAALLWWSAAAEAHHREAGRVYHLVTIAAMPTTVHTHVCVRGKATEIKREDDGDLHVRLEDPDGNFVIVESIPALKVRGTAPKVGEWAKACGIVRFDKKHGWSELHPVERWE